MIAPGFIFITRSLIKLLSPCIIFYPLFSFTFNYLSTLNHLASTKTTTSIGTSTFTSHATSQATSQKWILSLLSIMGCLGYMVIRNWFVEFQDWRKGKEVGCVLAPHLKESQLEILKDFENDRDHGYVGEVFSNWCKKYGNFYRFRVGVDVRYFTIEPEHIKAILATEFDSFAKGPGFIEQGKSLLGTGVFNADGDMWKFHRSITRPFFTKDRIGDFNIFERHTDAALKIAKERLAEGYPIDFQDLAARFTLDSATEFLFRNDVRSLDAGIPYPSEPSPLAKSNPPSFDNHPSNKFVTAFMNGLNATSRRIQTGGLWVLGEMWSDKIIPFRKAVDEYVEPFMEKALEEKRSKDSDSNLKKSENSILLDYLVEQTSDEQVIKDELVNLLVAGRDTTAALITFSLYMLIENPDICRRLRRDILEKIGKRCPTSEDIRDLKYLRAFLNEVLRIYPIVPINARESINPVILKPPTGTNTPVYLPSGSTVVYSVFDMHRRKDLWGPDALEFEPDRFLDERLHKYLVPNPFIFCPFNAGPRICLGQQFAYNEASFFLIRLLQKFSSFTMEDDARPPSSFPVPEWAGKEGPQGRDKVFFKVHLTMYVKGGLWVRMNEASSDIEVEDGDLDAL